MTRYGFTSQEMDIYIGLVYMDQRWYDPRTGQFTSGDPIEDDPTNANRYLNNSPTNGTDPTGLEVYVVARQFGFDPSNKDTEQIAATYKKRFESFPRVAHFYLMIELDDRTHTFSFHPSTWPETDPTAPWNDVEKQLKNLIDANERRPARVWQDDPADMKLEVSGYKLAHKKWTLNTSKEEDERLLKTIREFIRDNGVGHEVGFPIPDKFDPSNTHGAKGYIANRGGEEYWVYGQNCGWWSIKMLKDTPNDEDVFGGLLPPRDNLLEMREYNNGVGIFELSFPNDELKKQYQLWRRHVHAEGYPFGEVPFAIRPDDKPTLLKALGPAFDETRDKRRSIPKLQIAEKYDIYVP